MVFSRQNLVHLLLVWICQALRPVGGEPADPALRVEQIVLDSAGVFRSLTSSEEVENEMKSTNNSVNFVFCMMYLESR